jgi:hypothetical protein
VSVPAFLQRYRRLDHLADFVLVRDWSDPVEIEEEHPRRLSIAKFQQLNPLGVRFREVRMARDGCQGQSPIEPFQASSVLSQVPHQCALKVGAEWGYRTFTLLFLPFCYRSCLRPRTIRKLAGGVPGGVRLGKLAYNVAATFARCARATFEWRS